MCGITGLLNLDGAAANMATVRKMADLIAHRGPDGDGYYHDGPLGLGHRRLAIIDLSDASAQPIKSADARYVLVYNGELYNYLELRTELEAKGFSFKSSGDSEVFLAALIVWGEDALLKFNGMFAFALWDSCERTLLLGRDRFGVKPLYYGCFGNAFLFSSEIKAFHAHPKFETRVNKAGLVEYLTFQNFLSDETLYEGVKLLPQGAFLRVRADGEVGRPRRYWDFEFQEPEAPRPRDELIEELDSLFQQAVNRQLVSDVDVGAYLSGGLDSGSITAIASATIPFMNTFTVGFDLTSASGVELGFDERPKAEYMSYVFKTEHYESVLKAGDMERALPSIVYHQEEPRVGQCYPNFYAAKLASRFVKVVLSGGGGDELFGGYPWRYYRAAGKRNFDDYVTTYFDFWQRLVPDDRFGGLLAPIWRDVDGVDALEIFRKTFRQDTPQKLAPEDCLNLSLYFEAKTFLNGLLVMEDKLSMAHSLETRVPFLDNDLADFAMRLPAKLKVGNLNNVLALDENESSGKANKYYQKTRDGKLALREVMRRHIPPKVTDEIKQGFSAPDASWFKGESIDYVRSRLVEASSSPIYDVIDASVAKSLVTEHLSGEKNRRLLIWSLLYLDEWWKQHSPQC